jgi:hypothetical protein
LYPRTKSGILWFWSRTPPPPETVWFPEATDYNFERIVFIFGIHLWGVKVSPPIENGQGRVISFYTCNISLPVYNSVNFNRTALIFGTHVELGSKVCLAKKPLRSALNL